MSLFWYFQVWGTGRQKVVYAFFTILQGNPENPLWHSTYGVCGHAPLPLSQERREREEKRIFTAQPRRARLLLEKSAYHPNFEGNSNIINALLAATPLPYPLLLKSLHHANPHRKLQSAHEERIKQNFNMPRGT
jgi:hypothetical protein